MKVPLTVAGLRPHHAAAEELAAAAEAETGHAVGAVAEADVGHQHLHGVSGHSTGHPHRLGGRKQQTGHLHHPGAAVGVAAAGAAAAAAAAAGMVTEARQTVTGGTAAEAEVGTVTAADISAVLMTAGIVVMTEPNMAAAKAAMVAQQEAVALAVLLLAVAGQVL